MTYAYRPGEYSRPLFAHALTSSRRHGTGGPAGSELQPALKKWYCRKCTKAVPSNKATCPKCG